MMQMHSAVFRAEIARQRRFDIKKVGLVDDRSPRREQSHGRIFNRAFAINEETPFERDWLLISFDRFPWQPARRGTDVPVRVDCSSPGSEKYPILEFPPRAVAIIVLRWLIIRVVPIHRSIAVISASP